jgi:hypothetical protein
MMQNADAPVRAIPSRATRPTTYLHPIRLQGPLITLEIGIWDSTKEKEMPEAFNAK